VPHLEAAEPFDLGFLRFDPVHARAARAVVDNVDQPAPGGFFALEMTLDGAVSAIADPAVDAVLGRLLAGLGAKDHALHPAGDADVPRETCHHTVAMSGASSAFIPTTL